MHRLKSCSHQRVGNRWIEALLGLVYCSLCQLCERERAGRPEGFVCQKCRFRVARVVPPYCNRCGLPYEGEVDHSFVCSNCRDLPLEFDWARAAVIADPMMLDVIHRYKYNRALWFEEFLADLLVEQA